MPRDLSINLRDHDIRALLAGRKTQHRIAPKQQPPAECGINYMLGEESWLPIEKRTPVRRAFEAWTGPLFQNRPAGHLCGSFDITPRFQPRDRLWVRETWAETWEKRPWYRATPEDGLHPIKPIPSIHMPRWASRLTLVVEQVRVERLQDISETDAIAEGIEMCSPRPRGMSGWRDYGDKMGDTSRRYFSDPRRSFQTLWTSLHGADAWSANPWVVALTFAVHRTNIDKLEAREVADA